MQLKRNWKSIFFQPLIGVALSILAETSLAVGVLAQPNLNQDELEDAVRRSSEQQRREQEERQREQEQRQRQQQAEEQRRQEQAERSRLIEAGKNYLNAGNFADAEATFRQLLQKYPQDPYLYYQLGNVFFRQNKPEEAIAQYQQAIRGNSKYAVAYNAIGMVRASQGRWEEAISEYQKALEINPDYAEALYNFGLALFQQGKQAEAIAALEKARNLFKEQGRLQELRRVEQVLQETARQ